MSDGKTGIRQEIQDMILDTARHALERAGKPASSKDAGALIASFESMTRVYSGRHPLPDLLREMQAATEELLARKAGARVQDAKNPAMSALWSHAAKNGADEARERHLRKAKLHFREGMDTAAAEELCKAINCQIAAIAAEQGWPTGGLAPGVLRYPDAVEPPALPYDRRVRNADPSKAEDNRTACAPVRCQYLCLWVWSRRLRLG